MRAVSALNSSAGKPRARSRCRFVLPLIHFIPDPRTDWVSPFLKRQCNRTLGKPKSKRKGHEYAFRMDIRETEAQAEGKFVFSVASAELLAAWLKRLDQLTPPPSGGGSGTNEDRELSFAMDDSSWGGNVNAMPALRGEKPTEAVQIA